MRILVCAGVCAAALISDAAIATAQGVEGGLKAGITASTLSVTGLPGFEPAADAGLLLGGWVSGGGDRLRIQVEVLATTRRFTLASPFGNIAVSSRVVDVPVLVVGRWRAGSRTRPLLFAGPSLAFIAGVTQTVGATTTDIDDQIKGADVGAVAGAGVEIAARRGAVVLETRVSLGFRDLSEASETTFKSRTAMVSVGYRF